SLSPLDAVKVAVPLLRRRPVLGSGVNWTVPTAVHIPRWVAVPEAVTLAPIMLPAPSVIKVEAPFPLSAKGRSAATTGRDPSSSEMASARIRMLRLRFIVYSFPLVGSLLPGDK